MNDTQATAGDEPVHINALGPTNVADRVETTRHFDNNSDAVDAKQAEAIKAQTAPNPTTDVNLARQAYGEDWGRRRGARKIAQTSDGDPIFARGGVAVDGAGHALGHASDPEGAVATRETLVHKPEGTDADRYPVTAEARQRAEDGAGSPDDSYEHWSADRLQTELRHRQLPASGNKAELAQRLREDDEDESD